MSCGRPSWRPHRSTERENRHLETGDHAPDNAGVVVVVVVEREGRQDDRVADRK